MDNERCERLRVFFDEDGAVAETPGEGCSVQDCIDVVCAVATLVEESTGIPAANFIAACETDYRERNAPEKPGYGGYYED